MNRFRKLGYIEYNGHIQVNKSLLTVVLARSDCLGKTRPGPSFLDPPRDKAGKAKPA